jgi:hypothetical protein
MEPPAEVMNKDVLDDVGAVVRSLYWAEDVSRMFDAATAGTAPLLIKD